MEYTYTELKNEDGKVVVIARSDGSSIPTDLGNSDYQAYLNKDKAEQSTPIPTE